MSRFLAASDRSSLIRRASSLPAGSPERKAILAGLSKTSAKTPDYPAALKLVKEGLALFEKASDLIFKGAEMGGVNIESGYGAKFEKAYSDYHSGAGLMVYRFEKGKS